MRKNKRELDAIVLSNKMDKTIVVETKRLIKHPFFGKYTMETKKYKAHDEKNECQTGDRVLIRESKPISREKRWAVVKIVEKAATE
ncbi:MAG: 30S ribosomal protein S17 [Deltaproteobacteria bacterium]|nr:30S ribosomal protein S17 [Deltaproteobacteria bacterium]